MKRAWKWIGGIVANPLIVGALGIFWIYHSLNNAIKPNESLGKYQEVLNDWKASGLVNHFPSSVPVVAKNVKFSSFPGFMQGGGHVQLRLELPAEDVTRIYDDATKSAKQYQDGGDSVTLINSREDGLSSTSPHTLAAGTHVFPDDYRIFILFAEPYRKGTGFDWNHGESKGIVVSKSRNEVLYYAERW